MSNNCKISDIFSNYVTFWFGYYVLQELGIVYVKSFPHLQ